MGYMRVRSLIPETLRAAVRKRVYVPTKERLSGVFESQQVKDFICLVLPGEISNSWTRWEIKRGDSNENISIAMATYNGERFLQEQLDSSRGRRCCRTNWSYAMMARRMRRSLFWRRLRGGSVPGSRLSRMKRTWDGATISEGSIAM